MSQIDKALLDWVLSFDESDKLNAEKYGDFSLSRMDISVFVSDEEVERFDTAEKLMLENNGIAPSEEINQDYYRYIQAHNHELFHYYQALTLPAFQIYQRLSKGKLEHEADTMFRFFEEGNHFVLGKHRGVLEAMNQPDFYTPEDVEKNFNEIISKYKFYAQQWYSEFHGLSLFHIIEGMAHIFSVQLTDTAQNYLPSLEDSPDYHIAYDIFNSYINDEFQFLDVRTKHLTFLYICYFSCQIYDHIEDEVLERPSRLFHLLCSRLNLYFKSFLKLHERYEKYSENELRELNQFDINDESLKTASKTQISQIYAFFELIPCIEQDAEKYYRKIPQDTLKNSSEFLFILGNLDIDLKNPFQLANFSMFPTVWADFWEVYDTIQQTKIANNDFNVSEESAFYEFMNKCKKLLSNKPHFISCCEEHGSINNKLELLYCKNEGSFAYYLKVFTQRETTDLFKILED